MHVTIKYTELGLLKWSPLFSGHCPALREGDLVGEIPLYIHESTQCMHYRMFFLYIVHYKGTYPGINVLVRVQSNSHCIIVYIVTVNSGTTLHVTFGIYNYHFMYSTHISRIKLLASKNVCVKTAPGCIQFVHVALQFV